jgi:hypothetical protein
MEQSRASRWKKWVDVGTVEVLEKAARELKSAWKADMRSPDKYPIWTDIVFTETEARLRGEPPKHGPVELPPRASRPAPPPRRLSELLNEQTVKIVYEQQNNGSYEDALKIAAAGPERNGKAYSTFRKLLRAIEAAYGIDYCSSGIETIPTPKVHFLHRGLLDIADLARVNDLTHGGIVEFLDDLCPCGKRHTAEAIRKLRRRRRPSAPAEC